MSEHYAFPLRYDEKLVQSAVRGFVMRALFRENALRSFAPLALLAICCAMLFLSGEQELSIELFLFSLAVLAILVASGWRMHLRLMRDRVEAMKGRWPMARLCDEGVRIDGPGPVPLLEWARIKAVWPVEGAWLLILDSSHFIALPLAAAPKEALDFLQAHVAAARDPVAG